MLECGSRTVARGEGFSGVEGLHGWIVERAYRRAWLLLRALNTKAKSCGCHAMKTLVPTSRHVHP